MARATSESFNVLMAGALGSLVIIAVLWFLPAGEPMQEPADMLLTQAPRLVPDQQPAVSDQVIRLLEKGRLALAAELYAGPDGTSAAWFFREALRLDPGNVDAAQGFDAVVAALALTADSALSAGQYNDSVDWLTRARELAPDHDAVRAVASRQATRQRALIEDARGALQSGAFEETESLLMVARDLGPDVDSSLAELEVAISAERQAMQDRDAMKTNREMAASAARESRADVDRQVAALVAQAEERTTTGMLFEPDDDSALYFLQQAAVLDPLNTVVSRGFDNIVLALISTVHGELDNAETDAARRWLNVASRFGLIDPRIKDLRDEILAVEIAMESARVIPVGQLKMVAYVAPLYPPRLAGRQVEGWVDVRFTVSRDGTTANIEIADSSHENFFLDATREAVAAWRFEPRRYRGEIIDQRVESRVRYALD
jgi:TonB family protein